MESQQYLPKCIMFSDINNTKVKFHDDLDLPYKNNINLSKKVFMIVITVDIVLLHVA